MFIEHCRWFYPDIPEPPPPSLAKGKLSPPYTNSTPTSPNPAPSHSYTSQFLPSDTPTTLPNDTAPLENTPPTKPKPFMEQMLMGTTSQLIGPVLEAGASKGTTTQSETPPTAPKTQGSPPIAAPRQTSPAVAPKPLPKPLPSGNPPSPKMRPAIQQNSPVPKPRRSIPNENSSSNPPMPAPFTRTSSSGSTSSGSIPPTPNEGSGVTTNSIITDAERSIKTASLERKCCT